MTTILLIRHGESEANRRNIFAGHLDADLLERGLEQARKTADYIFENYKVDKVYASDLKRAYKTGKCIADKFDVNTIADENLREVKAGKWDGMEYLKIADLYPHDFDMWLNDIGNARCTDGESTKELSERIMSTITKIAKENDGKCIAIATHATPIRAMQCLVEKGDISKMKNVPWVSNASVSVFEYENDTWKIIKISEDKHLGDLVTSLPQNV